MSFLLGLSHLRVYPRVGGGNRAAKAHIYICAGLSPRGRGKPVKRYCAACLPRSIPAWAGETKPPQARAIRLAVYPRVGGGN